MLRTGEEVFVDTGAWIALAVVQDPLHARAREIWEELAGAGVRLRTSVPVVLETFTYLDRRGSRDLARRWQTSLEKVERFKVLSCSPEQLEGAFRWFDRKELHKLSLVDATSFVLMKAHRIRVAFSFDTHFGVAGFRYAG